jgi:hypothetical protein
MKELWKSTNNHTNIQYDIYNSTKEVLKDFHSGQEDKLQHRLIFQGSFFLECCKVFPFTVKHTLVCRPIKTTKEHFQLHRPLHKQLSSYAKKSYKMGFSFKSRMFLLLVS